MLSGGKKTPVNNDKIDTLIGKSTHLEGTIKAEGNIRIDGSITGELIISGNVILGESSIVKGNIKADTAYIAGKVEGNITANSQLHMNPTARILGDIIVKNVVIDEGAVFIGNCKAILENTTLSSLTLEEEN